MFVFLFIIQALAVVLGSLAVLLSIPLFLRLHWPSPALWFIKLYASAFSSVLFVVGVGCILVGLSTQSIFISCLGGYATAAFFFHILLVTRPPHASGSLDNAFGPQWKNRIPASSKKYFLPRRMNFWLPKVPSPRMQQNIPFATIPNTNQQLLCDIWQPAASIPPSGMAFVYLHGAAWYMLDKDLGTRPFFTHLAAQGHVIMDVAYRLAPESDMMGMVHDCKRAIAWMKEHAVTYGIHLDQIVVGGGSSGGHLALLAAYTKDDPSFMPIELEGEDVSVCGVISLYGPADLKEMYYHTNQHLTTRSIPGKPRKTVPTQMPEWIIKQMGKDYYRLHLDKDLVNAGSFAPLLGGHPDECPDMYALYSPVSHVHADCPPTLLIHGTHDLMAPVQATRELFSRLVKAQVPVVLHLIPQTDHAFDLQLPSLSPSAHNAIYDVERFLALQARTVHRTAKRVGTAEEYQPIT